MLLSSNPGPRESRERSSPLGVMLGNFGVCLPGTEWPASEERGGKSRRNRQLLVSATSGWLLPASYVCGLGHQSVVIKTVPSPWQFCPLSSESVSTAQLSPGSRLCNLVSVFFPPVSLPPPIHIPFFGPHSVLFCVSGIHTAGGPPALCKLRPSIKEAG